MFQPFQSALSQNKYVQKKFSIRKYIVFPLLKGSVGFFLFLVSILVSKYIGALIGVAGYFRIEASDVSLSSLGFLFLFLLGILRNLRD